MAHRPSHKQSKHDAAVRAAKSIYEQNDKHAWANPGTEKNKSWAGEFIDVIAVNDPDDEKAWVIEVETDDSVSESEADAQWTSYDSSFTNRWYLAVPTGSESKANQLLQEHGIEHCKVITWKRNEDGTNTYWGLPGV